MNELKFSRLNNDKYNTVSINIENAFLTLRDCEILKIEKTKYHYRKTVIQLNQTDLYEKIKLWETQINDYLKGEGISPITILYNKKIYPKTLLYVIKKGKVNYIKLKGIWVNENNKPFPQLWLE